LFAAKEQLDRGVDPSHAKQVKKHVGNDLSFKAIADEWLAIQQWSDSHRRTVKLRILKDLTPVIGELEVTKITPPDVLHVLRVVESRGSIETAHRLLTVTSQIMRYAVAVGHIPSDPCRDLKGALKKSKPVQYAAIVDPAEFGVLLRKIQGFDRNIIIGLALRLLPYVFLRSSEFRGSLWAEIDIEGRMWHIDKARMKKPRDHYIPLTDSTVSILENLRDYSGHGEHLFPSMTGKSPVISENALNNALKYLGYQGYRHTPHGFRSSFSTMANESDLFRADVIEIQLAHLDKNTIRAAYNRGEYMSQRIELMQWWSDQVDAMRLHAADSISET